MKHLDGCAANTEGWKCDKNCPPMWDNFKLEEFACSHCGANEMDHSVIDDLQKLRTELGFPFVITSGYRCKDHPLEVQKDSIGRHTTGKAIDIGVDRGNALKLLRLALNEPKWVGIGVNQKGQGRFLHLDQVKEGFWSY